MNPLSSISPIGHSSIPLRHKPEGDRRNDNLSEVELQLLNKEKTRQNENNFPLLKTPEILLNILGYLDITRYALEVVAIDTVKAEKQAFNNARLSCKPLGQAGYDLIHEIEIHDGKDIERAAQIFGQKTNFSIRLQGYVSYFGDSEFDLEWKNSAFTDADLQKLPKSLWRLSIHNDKGFTPAGLVAALKNLVNLEQISLAASKSVTNEVLAQLGELSNLKVVDLGRSCEFTAAGLVAMLENSVKLEKVILRGCGYLEDEMLAQLGKLPNLKVVDLSDYSGIRFTAAGLVAMLKNSVKLEQFILSSSKQVTDEVLDQLGKLLNLKVVDLSNNSEFTTAGLVAMLKNSVKLEQISLTSSKKVTNEVLTQLGELPNLKVVDLCNSNGFTAAGLVAMLKNSVKLEQFILSACLKVEITDEVLAQLWKLPNLKVVDLFTFNSKLTDAGWAVIKKLQERKILDKYYLVTK